MIASGPDRRASEVRETLARGGTVIGISIAAGSSLTALFTFIGSPGQLWFPAAVAAGLQAAAIAMFAAELGVPLLTVAYGMVYLTHGASNPLHLSLLHERCSDRHRSTVISVNSFAAQIAGTIGTVTLPAVAGAWSITVSLVLSAAIVAMSAILYPWAALRHRVCLSDT